MAESETLVGIEGQHSPELNMVETMQAISRKRPVFHSEADFQHALAWQLHEESSQWQVRLECPLTDNPGETGHLDLLLLHDGHRVAIELKYKKSPLIAQFEGETFRLKGDFAQDLGRYDFLRDVERLERATSQRKSEGYAVLLTNDPAYWSTSPRTTNSDGFRVTEQRRITGILKWSSSAGKGTTEGRTEPISIKGSYYCAWSDYSSVAGPSVRGNGRFRYLALKVT
jgi:hypothetical protein